MLLGLIIGIEILVGASSVAFQNAPQVQDSRLLVHAQGLRVGV